MKNLMTLIKELNQVASFVTQVMSLVQCQYLNLFSHHYTLKMMSHPMNYLISGHFTHLIFNLHPLNFTLHLNSCGLFDFTSKLSLTVCAVQILLLLFLVRFQQISLKHHASQFQKQVPRFQNLFRFIFTVLSKSLTFAFDELAFFALWNQHLPYQEV